MIQIPVPGSSNAGCDLVCVYGRPMAGLACGE